MHVPLCPGRLRVGRQPRTAGSQGLSARSSSAASSHSHILSHTLATASVRPCCWSLPPRCSLPTLELGAGRESVAATILSTCSPPLLLSLPLSLLLTSYTQTHIPLSHAAACVRMHMHMPMAGPWSRACIAEAASLAWHSASPYSHFFALSARSKAESCTSAPTRMQPSPMSSSPASPSASRRMVVVLWYAAARCMVRGVWGRV